MFALPAGKESTEQEMEEAAKAIADAFGDLCWSHSCAAHPSSLSVRMRSGGGSAGTETKHDSHSSHGHGKSSSSGSSAASAGHSSSAAASAAAATGPALTHAHRHGPREPHRASRRLDGVTLSGTQLALFGLGAGVLGFVAGAVFSAKPAR